MEHLIEDAPHSVDVTLEVDSSHTSQTLEALRG
jgi:hypothetical protein